MFAIVNTYFSFLFLFNIKLIFNTTSYFPINLAVFFYFYFRMVYRAVTYLWPPCYGMSNSVISAVRRLHYHVYNTSSTWGLTYFITLTVNSISAFSTYIFCITYIVYILYQFYMQWEENNSIYNITAYIIIKTWSHEPYEDSI